ncbi:MAG: hypothetical protein WC381_09985 [Kiritimatiellia bacterium]
MKPKALFILQVCALAVFLAGVLAALTALRQNVELHGKIRGKIETLAQLTAMKQTHDRRQAALRVFEGLSNAAPVSLASMSRAIVTNATPEIRERETRNLAAGWTLWQMEMVFNEINLNQIPGFLQAAEMQRPPWRLVECAIASSRQADGFGRVALTLETAGKTDLPTPRRFGGQAPDDGRQRADNGRRKEQRTEKTP